MASAVVSGRLADATRGYVRELDGLRGIAILLVLVHHFWPRAGAWAAHASLPHLGWIGVDLFFVISGFLIAGILLETRGDKEYYRNFYARRSLRIFPLYYVFVVAAFLLIPLAQGGPFRETQFVRESGSPLWYLLYMGNVREALFGKEPAYVLAPLWSLCIEEQFYLTFPFLVRRLRRDRLLALLAVLMLAAPAFRVLTFLAYPSNERIQYLATFSRMDAIAVGCLLALTLRRPQALVTRETTRAVLPACLALLAIAFAAGGLDRTLPTGRIAGYSLLALTFGCLVAWVVMRRAEPSTSWLTWAPLAGLGKICYGVYLLQRPSEVLFLRLLSALHLPADRDGLAVMFGKILAAIFMAVCSWFLFERPILRLKALFGSERHPAREGVPL